MPIPGLNRAVVQAINVARSISDDVRAVLHHRRPGRRGRSCASGFERQVPGVPLVVVESPYRALVGPLLAYLDVLDSAWPPDKPAPITFVVIPEYVARSWWERILYNQAAKRLRTVLLGRPHTVVVNVPYRREDPALFDGRPAGPRDRTDRTRRPARRPRRTARWYRDRRPCQTRTHPRSGARVIALNGGPSDARIVRLVAERHASRKAELIAVHVVEIDWTLPLDADIAGRSEEVQRVLDIAETVAEESKVRLEPVLLQARDVGAAIVDEAVERDADLLVLGRPVPDAVRRRVRHRPDHPVRPAERPVRGLGRARTDARRHREDRHRRLRPRRRARSPSSTTAPATT